MIAGWFFTADLTNCHFVVDGIKETCKLAPIVSITGFWGIIISSSLSFIARVKAITRLYMDFLLSVRHSLYSICYLLWFTNLASPHLSFTVALQVFT